MASYPFPWGPEPPGYVPGLGRGAVGFVNSIEVGKVDFETEIKSLNLARKIKKEEEKANAYYADVEEQMKSRNKNKVKEEKVSSIKQIADEIKGKFSALKLGLENVPLEDWENLPEIGATTYHRPKWDLYIHASDRMIGNDFEDSALTRLSRNDDLMEADLVKDDTDSKIMTVARAQRSVLSVQLSKIIPKQNSIDVTQFLHELDDQAARVISQFDDLDRAASLYRALTHSNKEDANSWLIRARVEEKRGNLEKAKKIARDGMINCPFSELLVMEAARLSSTQDAISLIHSALQVNHKNSEKLWLQFVSYHTNLNAKKSALEMAIRAFPKNEKIWLAAAAIEDGERHTAMLKNALEFLPDSKALWVEGINSASTYEEANSFVQSALEQLGECKDVLVAWAEADEKFNNSANINEICQRAIKSSQPTAPTQEENNQENEEEASNEPEPANKEEDQSEKEQKTNWINEATTAEKMKFVNTAVTLINSIPLASLGPPDKIIEEATMCESCEAPEVAKRLFLRNAVENGDFLSYINYEKRHDHLNEAVKLAIENRPEDDNMVIQITSVFDDLDDSRERTIRLLEEAHQRIPHSELIALTLIKNYIEAKRPDLARDFTRSIINKDPYISSLQVNYYLAMINEQYDIDIDFLKGAIHKFPRYPKFYLLLADHSNEPENILKEGLKNCPSSGEIHIAYIRTILQKDIYPYVRIRALFEKARRLCPNEALVWLLSAQFEQPDMRQTMLEDAKRNVAKEELGIVWSRQIELSQDQEGRLTLCRDALVEVKAPELYLMNAICLWRRGQVDKTRTAFENIEREFPGFGDGWVYRILFEFICGSPEDVKVATEKASKCKIEDGLVWKLTKSKKENFLSSQQKILEGLVHEKADPMSSEDSIYKEVLSLIDDLLQ